MKDYYVYEHIRPDNNTCFYVGKGHGKRYKCKSRNSHHDRIVKKYGMKTRIVKDGLSEQEAFELEQDLIKYYVFDLGYGIDIEGYRKSSGKMLSNHTFGGDGSNGMVHTKEWCEQHSKDMAGENNPMYGVNLWDTYSEEKKISIKDNLSRINSGKNNPMFNISPKDRMDSKTYSEWFVKNSDRCKKQIGNKNPNFGNDTLHNKVKDNLELRIQYYARPGSQNGRATKIHIYKNGEYIQTFDYIGLCAEWIKNTLNLSTKIDSIRGGISESIKNCKPYKGFTFSLEK